MLSPNIDRSLSNQPSIFIEYCNTLESELISANKIQAIPLNRRVGINGNVLFRSLRQPGSPSSLDGGRVNQNDVFRLYYACAV